MFRLVLLFLFIATASMAQVGSTANVCYWSGTVGSCLPADGILLPNQRDLRLGELTSNGTDYAAIQAPASFSTYTLTLPSDDGDADEVLSTNGSGTLDFIKIANANVDAAAAIAGSKIQAASSSNTGTVSYENSLATNVSWTFAGGTVITTVPMKLYRVGKSVTMHMGAFSSSAPAASGTLTLAAGTIPAAFVPVSDTAVFARVVDSGTTKVSCMFIITDGSAQLFRDCISSGFSGSATNGLATSLGAAWTVN